MSYRKIFIFFALIPTLVSCDTTRTIFKSQHSEDSYYTIKALTLSHCGCTFLYVNHYKNGEQDFQILYNDKIARKTLLPIKNKIYQSKNTFATEDSNYTIPFDALDKEIFMKIDSLILNKTGMVYELPRKKYKGYIEDNFINY